MSEALYRSFICDICEKDISFDGWNARTRNASWELAKKQGWCQLNGMHRCPDCVREKRSVDEAVDGWDRVGHDYIETSQK